LYDFGIMEYADEGDLNDFITTFPDMAQISKVIEGILGGLAYLHKEHIIHRDLKPHNILIKREDDQLSPKIIDFGISKMAANDFTVLSSIIGSHEYMSPEQTGGDNNKISTRTDLWSFGVILYQIFTGELPFGSRTEGHTSGEIIQRVLDGRIRGNLDIIPEPYQSMIRSCLKRNLNERVKNADALLKMMQAHPTPAPLKLSATDNKNEAPHVKKPSGLQSQLVLSQYSTVVKRAGAFFVDAVISFLLFFSTSFIAGIIERGADNTSSWVGLAIGLGYFLLRDTTRPGQSLGKILVNQHIWDNKSNLVVDHSKSFFRNLVSLLFLLTVILGIIEVLFILFNKNHKGLVDLITETEVKDSPQGGLMT
jgi:serine/threonine protein kinase